LTDPPLSRASPLPHWIVIVLESEAHKKARLIIDQPGFFKA